MKTAVAKLICCLLFIGASVCAQNKDSITKKITPKKDSVVAKTVKEEYLPPKKRKYTYFISDRLCTDDKLDIYKITPVAQNPHVIIIRGHLDVIDNPKQKKARITVHNASNNEMVGVYNTNGFTGNYLLVLVANVKYIFNVEVSGYGNLKEDVEVPLKIDYEICQQEIKIKLTDKKKPALLINNFFADENEKMFYIKSSGDTTRTLSDAQLDVSVDGKQGGKGAKVSSTIDELVKKQLEEEKRRPLAAMNAFKTGDLEGAANLYSIILKNDPGDPFVNYYYGVSLFKLNKNKSKAISCLQLASGFKEVYSDVFLYLGRAYHLSYIFSEAITAYEEYKKRVQPLQVQKSGVVQLIANCKNGIALMADPVTIEVVKRAKADDKNILASYPPEILEERARYKTDFFNSIIDKKKTEKLLITNFEKQEYIHASYGANEQNGIDLYKCNTLPSGTVGASQALSTEINTPFDENYPYLTKDGLTFYFSSKGHNSIGGYDIYKCTRTETVSPWSKPQNLGYPINSTGDDILFVPSASGQAASFCSNRKGGSFEYIEIKLPQGSVASSVIKGSFATLDSVPTREAIITVYNANTSELAGVYKTNAATGRYLMILTAGTKYEMTIDAEGFNDLKASFELPEKKSDFTLKQIIVFKKEGIEKSIKVNNYFREEEAAKVTFDDTPKANVAGHKDNSKKEIEIATDGKNKKIDRTAEERKKDAEDLVLAKSLFSQSIFQEAALIYQNLEKNIDLDPVSSYYYGMCLYNSKKDKNPCINALEVASTGKVPPNVFYYLGKANHESYRFVEAIKAYSKFKGAAKPEDVEKLEIDKEIAYCNSGIRLVNNPVVMEVYERKHVDKNSMQSSLNHIESGAKVLVLTDDMRSSIDKLKNYKPLLFLSADKNTLLYSSYGEDESKGKDIYRLRKMGNGKWSPVPENINIVNSVLDEEFPSLSKDGKTLYFSSKGFDNMGGYDIFKSVWDEKMEVWLAPVNMGSPINSPFDDIYYLE